MAVNLHRCLNLNCQIGDIDGKYLGKLGVEDCVMEVWDVCGGDVEEVYAGRAAEGVMKCYRGLCPGLKDHIAQLI